MSGKSVERQLELASFEVGANDVVLLAQAIRIATGERDLERAALLKIAEAAKRVVSEFNNGWIRPPAGSRELTDLRTSVVEWESL